VAWTSEQLAEAIAAVHRYGYHPAPMLYSSLLPYRPPVARKPATTPTTEIVRTPAYEAPVAPVEPATKFEAEPVPVLQALLDVTVWRSRPWWLRVAASVVVKRLNR
jgi:hypothetical protein